MKQKEPKTTLHLPYSDIRDGVVTTIDGSMAGGFELKPLDIECADADGLADIGRSFGRLLNSLPEGFQFQFVEEQKTSEAAEKSFSFWFQRPADQNKKQKSLNLGELLKSLSQTLDRETLTIKEGGLTTGVVLQALPLQRARIQSTEALLSSLSKFAGKEKSTSVRDLNQGDLVVHGKHFLFGEEYWAGVSVADFPDEVKTSDFYGVLPPNCHSMTIFKFAPLETEKVVEQLKRRRKVSASLTVTNSRLKDMESEAKLQSEDQLLESLIVGQEKVFDCQISCFVSASTLEELESKVDELSDRIRERGYIVYRETLSLYPVFQSCLPGVPIDKSRSALLPTSCAQALIPVFDTNKGHPNKVITFSDRFGGPVSIDPWDSSLTSFNAVISGTSGSGKSFLSNVVLKRLSETEQISTFIIDIGGSYRRLTALKGGQYLTFDVHGENSFNPLGNLDISDPSSLEAGVDILSAIIGDSKTGLAKYERNIVLQELCDVLVNATDGVTLSVLRERWKNSNCAFLKNASTILYGWTGNRAYGRLLDNNKSLEANVNWLCFDLRGLNDHQELQRVVMLAVVKRLWDVVRYGNEKKILLLDEVWALIQNNSGFIGEAFRTFRKHNASAIAVTQSLEDIATESLTAAVLNNTPTKIILKQSLKPERLRQLLNLNDREIEIVRSLQSIKGQYSEFFMVNGDHRRFLRLEPSAVDYWVSTTNAQDLEFIRTFMKTRPELTELQACNEISKLYGKERP